MGSRRTSFILLGAAAVLLLAIFIGSRMGNRVITRATELGQTGVGNSVIATPTPDPNEAKPYGPNWKRTQILAAAPDPGFPDPRVPPVAPPTPAPTPKFTVPPTAKPVPVAVPTPTPTATPNKNLPIWRQAKPLPIGSNAPSASPGASPSAGPPSPEPSPVGGPPSPPPG
ncbi:MAG: hypothetical protein DLM50_05880 [Candidatus Meridianibacter frigidus]|nr:MAG: hypothetical protein DLM50_05880 [Candidatus Eremiobacteraeota bacterium]